MALISDSSMEIEIIKMKKIMSRLRQAMTSFSGGIKNMPSPERARVIQKIQTDQNILAAFIETTKNLDVVNSGVNYALENLQSTFISLMAQWKKLQKQLDSYTGPQSYASESSGPHNRSNLSKTEAATRSYMTALKDLGHSPTKEQAEEFKIRLDVAYKKAQEKSGGKDLEIEVIQEDGKIKVRMKT